VCANPFGACAGKATVEVRVRVRVCACVCACMRVRVCACFAPPQGKPPVRLLVRVATSIPLIRTCAACRATQQAEHPSWEGGGGVHPPSGVQVRLSPEGRAKEGERLRGREHVRARTSEGANVKGDARRH
jgi:hypothetical protein